MQGAGMEWEELLKSLALKNLKKTRNGSSALAILLFCNSTFFQIIKLLPFMHRWPLHLMMVNLITNIFKAFMMLLLAERQIIHVPEMSLIKKERLRGYWSAEIFRCLAHLIGTSSDIKTKNKILFIEDVGEYIYNIDRMMYQLKRSGKLDDLAGLIVGKFTEMKDTIIPFGQRADEVIRDIVKEYDYPVCFNFPVSHEKENYALKIGCKIPALPCPLLQVN